MKDNIRNTSPTLPAGKSGQAVVEFVIALVIIIVLIAGLIQIGELSNAHTETIITARGKAGRLAMSETYTDPGSPRYVFNWSAGPDETAYTHDDIRVPATNLTEASEVVTAYARPGELERHIPGNEISRISSLPDIINAFSLVRSHESESVQTFPIIRHLFYDKSAIQTESEVCLTWTEGLY